MASLLKTARRRMANAFKVLGGANPHFEAASHSPRLRGIEPSKTHINRAIASAGETLTARSRWLYDNEPIYGSAVDEWVSAVVSDGIKPHPRIKGFKHEKNQLLGLWWAWVDEADYTGESDFYGLQETIAREVFMTGECFVRLRITPPDETSTVPLKLEIYPSEMLDVTYDALAEIQGNYIRMGIEFNGQGQRVAYHFFRYHPHDDRPHSMAGFDQRERVRIEAQNIIHIKENRQAGQLRGSPKITRSLVKLFQLEAYDDAELERKKTASMFSGFLIGRTENFFNNNEDKDSYPPTIQPGAMVDLGDDKDIRFSTPAEVGGSYEPFQYRNLLKICAGLNMPYAVVTGDVTRGNFSNVRTAIIQFRRHVKQWRANVMAFQLNRVVWARFVEVAQISGAVDLPDFDNNPQSWLECESFAPPLEMIEPVKDIAAEKEEIRAGLKTRTMALNERGYDRDDIDAEIADERDQASARGLTFDTDIAANDSTAQPPIEEEYESNQDASSHEGG